MTRPEEDDVRRLLTLTGLAAALVAAIWAGHTVQASLAPPTPVEVVAAATRAYAAGDCETLRGLYETPDDVDCAQVDLVQAAFDREGLDESDFVHELVADNGGTATVRVTTGTGPGAQQELVSLQKTDDGWKIAVVRPQPIG